MNLDQLLAQKPAPPASCELRCGDHRATIARTEEIPLIVEMWGRLDTWKLIRDRLEELRFGHDFSPWTQRCNCGMTLADYHDQRRDRIYFADQVDEFACPEYHAQNSPRSTLSGSSKTP